MSEKSINFEESFARLEAILEKLNSGAVSLDEALKLYEEADKLIASCNKRLSEAEKKIEILIKKRSGELSTTAEGSPERQDFTPPSEPIT